jgi:D-alanyl-lipoteichoic acid acyltransferase DltB (MBOAT superfamily)
VDGGPDLEERWGNGPLMDFVSVKMVAWMLLFLAAAWIPSSGRHPWFLTFLGSAFVFASAPLAGAILVAETLLCYFGLRRDNTRALVRVLPLTIVLSAAFLLCKYYASRGGLVLPLGISYFTFRLIHYAQIRYRGTVRPHSMIEFLAYMTFFPTFLVGPINLFPDFLRDLRRRHWDGSRFSWGLERVFYGYSLLIIGGNFLINSLIKPWIEAAVSQSGDVQALFLQSILLWLDLYVRFSAYSGIAIGLSAMAGYRAPENFDAPFFSANIREFWRRWHMSLTGWCREYIAAPITATTRRPYLAAAVTMVAIGIWHELSLRYLLWGLYHFAGIAVHRKWSARPNGFRAATPVFKKAVSIAGSFATTLFVISSFPVTTLITRLIESVCP